MDETGQTRSSLSMRYDNELEEI